MGVLADEEMPTLVAEASVLAMISAREGFGLAGMEALAAGVLANDPLGVTGSRASAPGTAR